MHTNTLGKITNNRQTTHLNGLYKFLRSKESNIQLYLVPPNEPLGLELEGTTHCIWGNAERVLMTLITYKESSTYRKGNC